MCRRTALPEAPEAMGSMVKSLTCTLTGCYSTTRLPDCNKCILFSLRRVIFPITEERKNELRSLWSAQACLGFCCGLLIFRIAACEPPRVFVSPRQYFPEGSEFITEIHDPGSSF